MYIVYIAKATENFGLPATRPIYEHAIEGIVTQTQIGQAFSAYHYSTTGSSNCRNVLTFCSPRAQTWRNR